MVSILVTGAVLISIGITLGILLSKRASKRDTDITPVLRWNASGITVVDEVDGTYGFRLGPGKTIYVVETYGNRVTEWLPNRSPGIVVAGLSNGTPGSAPNQFRGPMGIMLESCGGVRLVPLS